MLSKSWSSLVEGDEGYSGTSGNIKWANPGLFFVFFGLFKQTPQFLQQ